MFCNNLTIVFQLSGAFNGLFLQIILPVAFYIKAYGPSLFTDNQNSFEFEFESEVSNLERNDPDLSEDMVSLLEHS